MGLDPGTALAIVSALKARKEDVRSVIERSTQLQRILQNLQTWLHDRPTLRSSKADRVTGCVQACLGHIDEILKMCTNHSPSAATDIKSRLLHIKRGLQFPFQKETLKKLEYQIGTFRENVKLAVTLLAADFSFEGFEALEQMIQESEQSSTWHIKSHIDQTAKQTEDLFASSIEQLGSSVATQMRSDTWTVVNALQRLELDMTRAQDSLHQRFTVNQQSIADQLQEMRQFIRTVHNVSSVHDYKKSRNYPPHQQRLTAAVGISIMDMCTCNVQKSETYLFPGWRKWFPVTKDVSLVHERKCPVWYTSRRKITAQIHFRLFNFLVCGSLDFTGGFYNWHGWSAAPSPNLRCYWTVSSNSGAFAILRDLGETLDKSYDWKDRDTVKKHQQSAISKCLTALQQAFSTGRASPHDVNEDGFNILQVLSDWSSAPNVLGTLELAERLQIVKPVHKLWDIDLCAIAYPNTWIPTHVTPTSLLLTNMTMSGCRFWDFLYRCHSMEINNIKVNDIIKRGRALHSLLDWLIDSGFDIGLSFGPGEQRLEYPWERLDDAPRAVYPSILFPLTSSEFIGDQKPASRCNRLSLAVLRKDQQALRAEFNIHPSTLDEANYFGQSALHFATEWPVGLKILLNSGFMTADIMNRLDNEQHSALDYAAIQHNPDSVEILIQASACFGLHILGNTSCCCRDLLISSLFERRRQLQELAVAQTNSMAREDKMSLGSFTSDSTSRVCLQLLEEGGVQVPESLRFSVLSVASLFHSTSSDYLQRPIFFDNSREIFKVLLAKGFVQVDECWEGLTPLMTLQFNSDIIQVAELLLDNGADLDKELPSEHIQILQTSENGRRHRAAHKLAFDIGKNSDGDTPRLLTTPSLVAKAIFTNQSVDPCQCSCSPRGCSPLSSFLKGARDRFSSEYQRICAFRVAEARSTIALIVDRNIQDMSTIPMSFIRMMTFDSLQLTHICCSLGAPGLFHSYVEKPMVKIKEQVEIDRIRDEEVVDLMLLETLRDEFVAKFAELGCSLADFYRGYWRNRMEEELYKDEQIPEGELDGQRELAVWLTKDEDSASYDFFDGLWKDRAERKPSDTSRSSQNPTSRTQPVHIAHLSILKSFPGRAFISVMLT